jgi:hypothetical protein
MIEELPDLWSRLHGTAPPQPASIRMPRAPRETALAGVLEED